MFLLFLMHQMAISLFRLIGALGRTMVVAHTFGSFALMVIFLLGGFVISKGKGDSPFTMLRQLLLDLEIIKPHIFYIPMADNIHPWWLWAYWVSPLSYAQNAIAVNEFLSPRWQKVILSFVL